MGDEGGEGFGGKGWEGDVGGGFVEVGYVFVWVEEVDLVFGVFVGFYVFEVFEGVVEDVGGGVEGEVLVGEDFGGGLVGFLGLFYGEYVV